MTELALSFCLVLLVATFVWRPWMQYRRTGDHGYRGFSGGVSFVERFSGILFAASVTIFVGDAVAVLAGALSVERLPRWLEISGVFLMVAGFILVLAAQKAMGASWRVGVDPGEQTELAREGLFRLVRNPVFSAIGVFFIGFSLVVPTILSFGALVCGAIGIELQVRRVEEPYLLSTHGDAYIEYAREVGRFVPGIGRLG
jgi:protein-S-isoprenylcysteine O-methyltransferase Ste14